MATVPVYEWRLGNKRFGCFTQFEFDRWNAKGKIPLAVTRGAVVAHEPASIEAWRAKAVAA
jgi:hypothetical protein